VRVSAISGFNFPEASEKYESYIASLALIFDGQLPGSSPDESIAQVIWSSNQIKMQGEWTLWSADTERINGCDFASQNIGSSRDNPLTRGKLPRRLGFRTFSIIKNKPSSVM
jgi:hypothetical protein